MELEIGEYIRTSKGYILKIDKERRILQGLKFLDVQYGNIVKHSKNIIDSIGVGDYVNGYKVVNVIIDPAPSGKCIDIESSMDSSQCTFWEEDIKSIVTKEQFEQMKYIVEEEN